MDTGEGDAIAEENRASWNEATKEQASHKGDIAAFFREGGSTVFAEELELLGEIRGRSIAHIACNSGQDTVSLARLGAGMTGIDISDEAIAEARELAGELGLDIRFERADVYDWLDRTDPAAFDVVYCSYGSIPWFADLHRFAAGVARVLVPGGRFVTVEYHPLMEMFDDEWRLARPYPSGGRVKIYRDGVPDFVEQSAEGLVPWGYEEGDEPHDNPHPAQEYGWSPAEVITALAGAGFVIEQVREYRFSNGWCAVGSAWIDDDRRLHPPAGIPAPPMMYGIAARTPAA